MSIWNGPPMTTAHSHGHDTIGVCSLCGGAVVVPSGPWWSVVPPTPSCVRCGATPRQEGPVIEMEPAPRPYATNRLVIAPESEE